MDSLVFSESRASTEVFPAFLTSIGFFSSVNPLMITQVSFLSEGTPTLIALIGFLSSVSFLMLNQG